MGKGNVKLFAITTVFFAVFAIIFFALSVTSMGKYHGQKTRVHHMEQKILAGKKEILKVPEVIGQLRAADKAKQELEVQVVELTEASEDMNTELANLKREYIILSVAKAVLDIEKAGYTKNLIEARQAVEEMRNRKGTNDGGSTSYEEKFSFEKELDYLESHEETEETSRTDEEVSHAIIEESVTASGLHDTLLSIQKILQSSYFMFSNSEERHEMLSSLIETAKRQSESAPEIHQLINEFDEKLSSSGISVSEIFAPIENALAK